MNCCNYLQPYSTRNGGGGHFYPQQQFCYDNMTAESYATYAAAHPVSNPIENSAFRYNRTISPYPSDYVYNPKEARLRKAMREQSRELSRQSILQTTITSSSPSESTGSDCISSSAVANFSHPHAMNCVTSPVSMLTSSIDANRIIGPWFPVGQPAPTSHLEPAHAPKVMATHQRTIDKSKEDIRKQVERHVTGSVGFSGAMPPNHSYRSDFAGHGPVNAVHRENDYCMMSELAEPQKWHPYQNGVNIYQMRNSMMPKVGSMHCNMSSSGHRPPSHWGQFCSMPLPNLNENATMRSPRHLTYLQEQQSQHCATPVVYPDDMQIPYRSNQMDVNNRPALSYQQSDEHRITDLEKVTPVMVRAQRYEETIKNPDPCCPRREPVAVQAAPSSVSPTVTPVESSSDSLNSRSASASPVEDSQQYPEKIEQKKSRPSKQPLPGFHQAFGSTEIGRFSRSEFFASMMADEHSLVPNGFIRAPMYPFSPAPSIYQDNFPPFEENLMLHHPNGPGQYFYMNSMPNPETENPNYLTFVDCPRHANPAEWHQIPFMERPMMSNMHDLNSYHYHDMINRQQADSQVPSQGLDLRLPEIKKAQNSKSSEAELLQPKEEFID